MGITIEKGTIIKQEDNMNKSCYLKVLKTKPDKRRYNPMPENWENVYLVYCIYDGGYNQYDGKILNWWIHPDGYSKAIGRKWIPITEDELLLEML
jgi:hypothetical protein